MNSPKVSVIIPVYDVEKYLRQCLDSVVNQALKDIEIIIVTDGPEACDKICEEFAKKDSRIKIIYYPKKGLGGARNAGVEIASGEFISFVDSDDWLTPNAIEKMYTTIKEKGLDSVWTRVNTYLQNKDEYTTENYYKSLAEYPAGELIITPENFMNFPVNAWNKMYKKSTLDKFNIKFHDYMDFEDVAYYFKFYMHAPKTYIIDDFLYIYRWSDDSAMNKIDAGNGQIENLYITTLDIYNYMVQNNLWEKYKTTFIVLFLRNIRLYLWREYYRERVVIATMKILKAINFNEQFKEFCSAEDYNYLNGFIIRNPHLL